MTALAERYIEHYERLAVAGTPLPERPRNRRWSRMLVSAAGPRLSRYASRTERSTE
jgi:hypothetical protein